MKTVIKKDGRRQKYKREKLIDSILSAFEAIGPVDSYAEEKANNIADFIESLPEDKITAEELGNKVEQGLMNCKRSKAARHYILYRDDRDKERSRKTKLMREIKSKIDASNIENQNANVDEYSFGGRRGEATNAFMKDYAIKYCISPVAANNHLSNEIYIHDLDSYSVGMHNCLSIPFDMLLEKGFNTRQTDVRPAGSINTAFQLVAVIFQLQSLQQFGGVSATHLDWTMVPYVQKSFKKHWLDGIIFCEQRNAYSQDAYNEILNDGDLSIDDERYQVWPNAYNYAMQMTQRELDQAVEGMYHNLNTLQSRSGNQLPFTSINYGTCTSTEGRMVIKSLLEGSLKGVGKHHKTPIFPCGIFQMMKGVNRKPGDPNYDLFQLALKSTAKRLYPNYANCDWSGNAGYDPKDPKTYFSTMGCRTANGFDINAEEGTNPQTKDGRGNICPVTIIMPTLAMEATELWLIKHDIDDAAKYENNRVEIFMQLLDKKLFEARDMLIERFEFICKQNPLSAKFMYENGTMLGYHKEEGIRSALKHGTLALGQLGLAETLQILIGKDHTTEEGMKLAKRIEGLFKQRVAEFKQDKKLNFGVYYTPAETLCYTAMNKFKAKYGIIEGVSDREYFTNSIHVPVWKEMSPFDKIDIEAQLTGYSSAGCITYVELDGGMENNLAALEELVTYAMDKDIPYFAINVPNDTCCDCGYTGEFNGKCPECGSTNIQQLRRVTGYLTGNYKTAFNPGKQKETEERFRHADLIEV